MVKFPACLESMLINYIIEKLIFSRSPIVEKEKEKQKEEEEEKKRGGRLGGGKDGVEDREFEGGKVFVGGGV